MQKKVGKYLLVQEIGKGQFGSVYRALDRENNDAEYAVKLVARNKLESNSLVSRLFSSEINIMKQIDHPHLLRLCDFIETTNNYYVVVQYCKDGDLEKYLAKVKVIEESEAVFYLKQIMSGFLYLHQKKIMHRDFKLANIFMEGKHLTIGDFGFAKAGVDVATTKLGTPYNMAPEIMFSTGNTPYTSKADLWSIGVVLYQMLFGVLPFQANTMDELKSEIKLRAGKNLIFPSNVKVSLETKNLLKEMLEFDPVARLSWKKFFNHPVFEKFNEFGPAKSILASSTLHQSFGQYMNNLHKDSTLNENIEYQFHKEKQVVNTEVEYSTNFDIPDIVQLQVNPAGGQTYSRGHSQSNCTFGHASSLQEDGCNSFVTHERNKYLLVLQTAKRVKEILKIQEARDKHGHALLLALALCKRAILMIDFLTRTLYSKVNIFKLDGFEDFCSSSIARKLLQAFAEEKQTSTLFMQHLEAKLKEPWAKNLDSGIVDSITEGSVNEAYLDVATEKLLVHLLNWIKINSQTLTQSSNRQFMLAMVYVHYTLNLNFEFPIHKDGQIFNWRLFFAKVDSLEDVGIGQIIYPYYQKKDQVGKLVSLRVYRLLHFKLQASSLLVIAQLIKKVFLTKLKTACKSINN